MIAHSIRDSLDQNWPLLLQNQLSCLLGGVVDSDQVITIDTNGGHAIGHTPDHDAIARVLLVNRSRDGVHVVSAVEEGLRAQSRSEVQRTVEVAHRGGTFAEVCDCDAVLVIDAEVVSSSGSLGHLCAKGRADRDYIHVPAAIVDGHLLALAEIVLITCQLMSHLLDGEAAPQEDASFAVLGEHQICVVEGSRRADAGRLFA